MNKEYRIAKLLDTGLFQHPVPSFSHYMKTKKEKLKNHTQLAVSTNQATLHTKRRRATGTPKLLVPMSKESPFPKLSSAGIVKKYPRPISILGYGSDS